MHSLSGFLSILLRLGGFGQLLLGILDSSFLFAPLGNDLLMVAMTAQNPHTLPMLYNAAMATVGSVLGCLLVDVLLRPLGEKGLEKYLPARRIQRVQKKVGENAGRALAIASLAPPPFPFTPFVMAAAALQYSRCRMLIIVGIARMVRFTVIGLLALRFGKRILQWGANPVVQGVLIGLVVVCVIGSVVSVVGWLRRAKGCAPSSAAPAGLHQS